MFYGFMVLRSDNYAEARLPIWHNHCLELGEYSIVGWMTPVSVLPSNAGYLLGVTACRYVPTFQPVCSFSGNKDSSQWSRITRGYVPEEDTQWTMTIMGGLCDMGRGKQGQFVATFGSPKAKFRAIFWSQQALYAIILALLCAQLQLSSGDTEAESTDTEFDLPTYDKQVSNQ